MKVPTEQLPTNRISRLFNINKQTCQIALTQNCQIRNFSGAFLLRICIEGFW